MCYLQAGLEEAAPWGPGATGALIAALLFASLIALVPVTKVRDGLLHSPSCCGVGGQKWGSGPWDMGGEDARINQSEHDCRKCCLGQPLQICCRKVGPWEASWAQSLSSLICLGTPLLTHLPGRE